MPAIRGHQNSLGAVRADSVAGVGLGQCVAALVWHFELRAAQVAGPLA